jgi:hypothetical protein
VLDLGGSGGAGGGLVVVEVDLSQPKGPRRGGSAGSGALTGGVRTPEDADDTDPRFRGGSSGGTGVAVVEVASVPVSEERRLVSSKDISVRGSCPLLESLCEYFNGDFSRFRRPFRPFRKSGALPSSRGSAVSEAGLTLLDVASTKSSLS